MRDEKLIIAEGRTSLGIEFGSTRIKAVLINEEFYPIAMGSYEWENRWENGIWTYHTEDIWKGIQAAYQSLKEDVEKRYHVPLKQIGVIGISGMQHGYLALDRQGELLVPFRTWRNTMTKEASAALTELFQYPIPQRWSIAHLYQAILNQEEHLWKISYLTTLAGYVHWKLTGEKVAGLNEASGMFPIDERTKEYDKEMLGRFQSQVREKNFPWKLEEILPRPLPAGEKAGNLTKEGAMLLDVSGTLEPGIPFCPPEGDGGTGMVATNSVSRKTGNLSAGTSAFAMLVLDKKPARVHPEIDLVITPGGNPVGMAHCNNCTSDLNAWIQLFGEALECFGVAPERDELYRILYGKALEGDLDCGKLLAYNYFSGEHITGLKEGRPLFVRLPDSRFTLANFMKVHLYTALGAVKKGVDILRKEEKVEVEEIVGHGGFFKTEKIGQKIAADALGVPVSVMETAGEGGPWGMALLGAYQRMRRPGERLEEFLSDRVFVKAQKKRVEPDRAEMQGYENFMKCYEAGLAIEQMAVDALPV